MDNLSKLRAELRKAVKAIPEEKREKAERMFTETISEFCARHVQVATLECAEDLGMDAFDTLLDVVPMVAITLLRGLILNILLNTDEQDIETSGALIDKMLTIVMNEVKTDDYHATWKTVHKNTLEAALRGDVEARSI